MFQNLKIKCQRFFLNNLFITFISLNIAHKMEKFATNIRKPNCHTPSQIKFLQSKDSLSLIMSSQNKSQNQSQSFIIEAEENCNIYENEDDGETFSADSKTT